MSKSKKLPAGLPPVAEPIEKPATPESTPPEAAEPAMTVEEEAYQLEQETVTITAEPPTCPRCGSTERTRLLEISPRLETDCAVIIRYRTQCRGRIFPVDKEGKPVTDNDGKPISYECGNRYKVKKLVPKTRKSAS